MSKKAGPKLFKRIKMKASSRKVLKKNRAIKRGTSKLKTS